MLSRISHNAHSYVQYAPNDSQEKKRLFYYLGLVIVTVIYVLEGKMLSEEKANEIFYKDMIETVADKLLLSEINDIAYNVMETTHIRMKQKFLEGG